MFVTNVTDDYSEITLKNCRDIINDYNNITLKNHTDTTNDYNNSSIPNFTNNEVNNDIIIPSILLTVQCGLSFLCLISFYCAYFNQIFIY